MKKLSLSLNIILLILVGVLFYLHFKSVNEFSNQSKAEKDTRTELKENRLKIAYVNLDSLEAHYTYFRKKSAELDKKKQTIQNELASKTKAIQNDIQKLQKNAATLTQAQGEAAEKKIIQKRQQLQKRQQQLQQELMQEQQSFNQDLHQRLDDFLNRYNVSQNYDYIFSYSSQISPLLYKNESFNITADVIKGLNKESTPSIQ